MQVQRIDKGRALTKEKTGQHHPDRTQGRGEGVQRGRRLKFTALLHHINIDLLRENYYKLKRQAAPGVDGWNGRNMETGWKSVCQSFIGGFIAEPTEQNRA